MQFNDDEGRPTIGTVKWVGTLPGKQGKWVGIAIGDGRGTCNGMYQGKQYFTCKEGKGGFYPVGAMKREITAEELLTMVKKLTNKVKDYEAKKSELTDAIAHINSKPIKQSFAGEGSKTNLADDSDKGIQTYLAGEITKGWYCSFHDLCTRYDTRSENEIRPIYNQVKGKFNQMGAQPGHTRIVYTVAGSKRDNLFASGSDDKTICLWRNVDDAARCIAAIKIRSCINSLAFSPDGSMLAAALDSGWIELYDVATGKVTRALEGQTTSEVWTCSFSPDGAFLVSGALDRAVRVWDTREQECLFALRGHDEWVNGVAVDGSGKFLVSGSGDKTVRIWDTKTMKERNTLRGHTDFVRSVCVTDDYVVSASDDMSVRMWDIKNNYNCRAVLKGHKKGIYCVAAGKNNTVASASRDSTVRLWVNGKETQKFEKHTADVNSCCFIDDGKVVVSGSDDKSVKIFRHS